MTKPSQANQAECSFRDRLEKCVQQGRDARTALDEALTNLGSAMAATPDPGQPEEATIASSIGALELVLGELQEKAHEVMRIL